MKRNKNGVSPELCGLIRLKWFKLYVLYTFILKNSGVNKMKFWARAGAAETVARISVRWGGRWQGVLIREAEERQGTELMVWALSRTEEPEPPPYLSF